MDLAVGFVRVIVDGVGDEFEAVQQPRRHGQRRLPQHQPNQQLRPTAKFNIASKINII